MSAGLTGLKYYSDLVGIFTGSYSAYFDFNNYSISGGNLLVSSPAWIPPSNGKLIGPSGNFGAISGQGYFSGQYIDLDNQPRNFDNWTAILAFQVSGTSTPVPYDLVWDTEDYFWDLDDAFWQSGDIGYITGGNTSYNKILFSCFPSGASGTQSATSGYFCGINNANKLFFTHWNTVDGPQTYTYSGFIPSKSIICASKQGNNLNLGVYCPNLAGFDFQQFGIYNSNIVINNDWYLGGAPSIPAYYPTLQNFNGLIDEFILLSGNAYQPFLSVLTSGFWSCPTGYTSGVYTVTGQFDYISGIFSGYSGITGYQNILQGTVTDSCGNVENIFINTPLTGAVTGIYYISGTQTVVTSGVSGIALGFQTDLPYYNSLGMEGITIFYEILSGNDTLEYFSNNVNDLTVAQNNNYDRIPKFALSTANWTLDAAYPEKTIPVFENGQLQLESGYSTYLSGYTPQFLLTGDYFLTGLDIQSSGNYLVSDLMLYDYNPSISGNQWKGLFFSGNSSGYAPFPTNLNDFVYVNGQKLTTGINIGGAGVISLNVTGQNTYQYIRISGLNNLNPTFNGLVFDTGSININKFLKHTSVVFYNGIRQSLLADYVERGIFDKLTGEYYSPFQVEVIYSNTRDFYNL